MVFGRLDFASGLQGKMIEIDLCMYGPGCDEFKSQNQFEYAIQFI
jgi:hypothetical protein